MHVCRACKHSSADVYQVVIFERATFLVIAHSTHRSFSDVHRFEKVSNIIKQFKLSCTKSHADFRSMQVSESACFSLSLSLYLRFNNLACLVVSGIVSRRVRACTLGVP